MSDVFKVSGKKIKLEMTTTDWNYERRPGGWVVATRTQNGVVERKRFFAHENKGNFSVNVGGKLYFGKVESVARGGVSSARGSDADLVAQFPGKVRKILIQEGATVKEGEPLLLIEAMKMEFSVKAPFDGKVKKLLVKEAQQLNPGDRFLDLEVTKK